MYSDFVAVHFLVDLNGPRLLYNRKMSAGAGQKYPDIPLEQKY